MKKRHPLQVYVYIWAFNIIALTIAIGQWKSIDLSTLYSPVFLVWLVMLCVARHGGLFRLVNSKVSAGLANVVEFATLIILPFELYVLSIIVSYVVIVTDRLRKKHQEPFLGPDFNASNVIVGGFISEWVFSMVLSIQPLSPLVFTIALFTQALIFGFIQISLLNTLICLDEKLSWRKGPVLQKDTILTEGILMIIGALLGTTFLYNPYLVIFFILPALFIQKLLVDANKSQLIYLDEKTGIYNYRYFDEKINEIFQDAKRSKQSFSLIFGDMDFLRDINNNHGHAMGDQAIIQVGKIFKQKQEDKFISARFGGEEFVMILPKTNKVNATQHAEMIREEIENIKLLNEENEKINVSISVGVATYPDDAHDIQTLIQLADEALYEAKRKGKNQVCVYHKGDHVLPVESTKWRKSHA